MTTAFAPLLLAAMLIPAGSAAGQQPAQARPSVPTTVHVPAASAEPRTAYDSTVLGLRRIGQAVAEVKTAMDAFRRASIEPDGVMLERAALLRAKCRALTTTAEQQGRRLCRTCVGREQRTSLDAYRAYLPSLQRVAQQCATTITRLGSGQGVAGAATRLRRESRNISNRIVEGLVPYEQRLTAVRVAFGWAPTPQNPVRRGS